MEMSDKLFFELSIDKEMLLWAKQRLLEHFKGVNKNYPHLEY
jgi:hypothetical protein